MVTVTIFIRTRKRIRALTPNFYIIFRIQLAVGTAPPKL